MLREEVRSWRTFTLEKEVGQGAKAPQARSFLATRFGASAGKALRPVAPVRAPPGIKILPALATLSSPTL